MKIDITGGGPSGLYLAYLARRRIAGCDGHLFERNAPDATYGFGVVLAGRGMAELEAADANSLHRIVAFTRRTGNQRIVLVCAAVAIQGAELRGRRGAAAPPGRIAALCEEQGVRVR